MRPQRIRFYYFISLLMIFTAFAVLFFIIAFLIVLNIRGAFECTNGFCTLRSDFSSYNFLFITGIALIMIFIILSSYFQQYFLIDSKKTKEQAHKKPEFSTLFSKDNAKAKQKKAPKQAKPIKERLIKPSPSLKTYEPKKRTAPTSAKKKHLEDTRIASAKKAEIEAHKVSLDNEVKRKRRTIAHTKEDLSLIVAKRVNMNAEDARKFLDITFDVLFDTLKNHEKVNIHKFGTFTTSKLKARTMQVPSKGEETTIPEHHVVRFKGSDVFEDFLNGVIESPPIEVDPITYDNTETQNNTDQTVFSQSKLLESIAGAATISEKEAKVFLKHLTKTMIDTLSQKEPIMLYGFGSFEVVERQSKKMVIPKTGETREIASYNTVKFTPGKPLLKHFDKNTS